jgi:hypothetical protein
MTISPEQLKCLTTPQLRKLEKALLILSQLEHNATCNFDQLLEQIRAPQSALSQTDAHLIGARTYELQIYKPHLDTERARAQAMREFKAGKLHQPKIPRRRSRSETTPAAPAPVAGKANVAIGPALAATPANLPTRPATAPPPLPIEALPDNVFPLRLYSKFFHGGRDEDNVW